MKRYRVYKGDYGSHWYAIDTRPDPDGRFVGKHGACIGSFSEKEYADMFVGMMNGWEDVKELLDKEAGDGDGTQ